MSLLLPFPVKAPAMARSTASFGTDSSGVNWSPLRSVLFANAPKSTLPSRSVTKMSASMFSENVCTNRRRKAQRLAFCTSSSALMDSVAVVSDAIEFALCVRILRLSFFVYSENEIIITLPSTTKLANTMTIVIRRYLPKRDFCTRDLPFSP